MLILLCLACGKGRIMDLKNIFNLHGKTVLVTGGAGHLGSAMSEIVAAYGANLYILGNNAKKNADLAKKLKKSYGLSICESMAFNIDSDEIVAEVFRDIFIKTGSIDVLINNAAYSSLRQLHECTTEEWEKGIDGTINGVYRATRCALSYMMKQNSGNIINIASMYGMVAPDMEIYGDSGQNNPASYGAGKAAIIQLTKYIAAVYANNGIRANSVSPGAFPNKVVQSDVRFISELCRKNPMHRIGTPSDLQGIILYLASDASAYTNGQNIAVDGGWTAW